MARTRDVLDDLAEWYSSGANEAPAPRSLFDAPTEPVGLSSAARRGLVRVAQALLAWHDRARQRRALLDLSDHMLRDIGISRAEALGEAEKPFWQV